VDESTLSAQPDSDEPEVPMIEARLDRAQVETGLSGDDYLMQQVLIYPYTGDQGEQLEGFRISNIRAGNMLLQMGFRSGDVITGVDGEPVRSPDEAAGFFERLTKGGKVTIDINRRRRPLKVRLNIL
jgi:type II secretory pathway component PulC